MESSSGMLKELPISRRSGSPISLIPEMTRNLETDPCHCIRSLCLPGAHFFQIRGRREVLAEGLSERRSRIFCELVYDFIIF
mgnify:CR=1 FL=1